MLDFLKIGASIKNFADQLKTTRAEIEAVKQEMENVVYARSHPDDVIAAAEIWLKTKEDKFLETFDSRIVENLMAIPQVIDNPTEVSQKMFYSPVISMDEVSIVGLIGAGHVMDLIKQRLAALPAGSFGLKQTDRRAALEKLRAKLDKLKQNEAELLTGAEQAGIVLQ